MAAHKFEVLLGLLGVAVGLGVLARWLRVPYPILLVLGGLLLSLQPDAPRFEMDPGLAFVAFLPPLLYAAAFNTRWRAFRRHLRAITLLAVGLVLFTTVLVAAAAHHWCGLPWTVGFVLGAIVSPPDAVAAVAVTRRMRVPAVVSTLLEGESLVNDAAALVAYRMAVAAVVGGGFDLLDAGGLFVLVSAGGVAFGLAGGVLVRAVHGWLCRSGLADDKLHIALTLLTPYAVYLAAEAVHVSGVLAVVAAGLWVGHRAAAVFPDALMREARAVWEMTDFLLNSLIFMLIGMQLPVVLDDLDGSHGPAGLAGCAAVVGGVVILARIVWVFPGAYLPRWLDRQFFGCADPYPPWQVVAVVAWTGMRGVVSLAAALALPHATASGSPFPGRGLVLFLSFWVIFATLVGQGLTLPLLIRWLGVSRLPAEDADPAEQAGC